MSRFAVPTTGAPFDSTSSPFSSQSLLGSVDACGEPFNSAPVDKRLHGLSNSPRAAMLVPAQGAGDLVACGCFTEIEQRCEDTFLIGYQV